MENGGNEKEENLGKRESKIGELTEDRKIARKTECHVEACSSILRDILAICRAVRLCIAYVV